MTDQELRLKFIARFQGRLNLSCYVNATGVITSVADPRVENIYFGFTEGLR